ncbi:sensor histidine kinase [uncultured Pseudokineococcus sp.]|uniref:sensor histidine kinase n=1 Tax=uncultured Pseudokineococcus sp. TaxID=1642928 RepID=UPI00261E17FB|nr:sensor histidine kinase [uncultured Pseudokineococcus sp.]
MPSSRRGPRSVAAHLMWWQVLVVLVVVAVGAVLAGVDARRDAERSAGERASAVAETVADAPEVLAAATGDLDDAARTAALQPFAERVRAETGTSFVVVMAPDGTRWTHPDPAQVGRTYLGSRAAALAGGRVLETYTGTLGPSVRAVVPVRADGPDGAESGPVVALVSAGISVAAVGREVARDVHVVAVAGGAVLVLALGGSYLVARRARRLTLGLAGPELARMFTYYDTVLRSVREGLLLVDAGGRVQLVNAEARRLLDLPDADDDVVGRPVAQLPLPAALVRLLTADDEAADEVLLTSRRVLVASVRAARAPGAGPDGGGAEGATAEGTPHAGAVAGRVVTLRDRTDLLALTDELETTRSLAEALRSQAHEFSNRLHTVVQLVEMGRVDEAVDLAVDELAEAQALTDHVVGAVDEPVVAALLLGASARAGERGVELVVAAGSALDEGALERTGTPVRDVLTVLGNLLDNAVDAAATARDASDGDGGGALVEVLLGLDAEGLAVEVSDSGRGLSAEEAGAAFRRGWSTKDDGRRLHGRGLGLALVGQTVERLGGRVEVDRSVLGGARFRVLLPAQVVPEGRRAAL